MLDPDIPLMFCARVADTPLGILIPAEVQKTPCSECGCPLWASPSTMDSIRAGMVQAVCQECRPDNAVEIGMNGPQAQEEYQRYITRIVRSPQDN